MQFWLTDGHFWPLSESPLQGKKLFSFQTWLKKFLGLPSWSQGAKLARQIQLGGSKWPNMRFWLKNGHFWPLSDSLFARGETFDLLNLAKKFLGSPSWSQGAKLV